MTRRRSPPSQGWRTFLRNHFPDIGAIDMFDGDGNQVCPEQNYRFVVFFF